MIPVRLDLGALDRVGGPLNGCVLKGRWNAEHDICTLQTGRLFTLRLTRRRGGQGVSEAQTTGWNDSAKRRVFRSGRWYRPPCP